MDRDLRTSSGRQRVVGGFRPTAVGILFSLFVAVTLAHVFDLSLVHPSAMGLSVWAPKPWTFFTFAFQQVHLLLLLLNLLALYLLGRPLERHFGSLRFTFHYLGTSVLAGLATFAIVRILGDDGPRSPYVCGAAGGTFGLLLLSRNLWPDEVVLGRFPMRHAAVAGMVLLIPALLIIQNAASMQDRIDLRLLPQATGVIFAFLLQGLDTRVGVFLDRRRIDRRVRALEEELCARERVEDLLERIARLGMNSLTRREYQFLRSASRYYKRRT